MSQLTFLNKRKRLADQLNLDWSVSATDTLLTHWWNATRQDFASRHDWRFLEDRITLQTVADITTGTISVSAAGTAVTGSGTSFAAADVAKYIQFGGSGNEWYRISARSSGTAITIANAYNGTTALSGETYKIRQFYYDTNVAIDRLVSLTQAISPRKLTYIPARTLDLLFPFSEETGRPRAYTVFRNTTSSNSPLWQVVFFPNPDAAYNIECRYLRVVTDLSTDANGDDIIPDKWADTVIMHGALAKGAIFLNDPRQDKFTRDYEAAIERAIDSEEGENDSHTVLRTVDSIASSGQDWGDLGPQYPRLI